LGAVKPSRGHRPELQGSDCPTTRLGGVFKRKETKNARVFFVSFLLASADG